TPVSPMSPGRAWTVAATNPLLDVARPWYSPTHQRGKSYGGPTNAPAWSHGEPTSTAAVHVSPPSSEDVNWVLVGSDRVEQVAPWSSARRDTIRQTGSVGSMTPYVSTRPPPRSTESTGWTLRPPGSDGGRATTVGCVQVRPPSSERATAVAVSSAGVILNGSFR